jgi:HK97 family phage portal protein
MIFKKYFQKLVGDAVKSLPLNSLSTFNLGGWSKETEFYSRWIFSCVNLISNKLAETEWRLYQMNKKGEVVEVLDHELLGLLYKFNDQMTKFDSLKLSFIYFLLQGSSPWILDKNEKGKTEQIFVVPPSQLKVAGKDANGNPTEYKYNGTIYSRDKVIIFKNPDPNNPKIGRSHIEAIREVAETDDKMTKWNKNLMISGAKPSVVVEVPAILQPNEQKLLQEQFNEAYGGFENANKVMVLSNGAKMNPYSIPPKDLEWIQGRGMNRDEILSVFGVPKILLGLEGQYNRATAETSEMVFGKYTLDPIMTMITEQLNEFLVPMFGDNLYLDFESFAPEDSELQLKWLQAGTNVWMTVNEARESLGKEPLRGGDSIYQSIANVPTMTEQQKKDCGCGHDHKDETRRELKAVNLSSVPLSKQRKVKIKINSRNIRKKKFGNDIADKAIAKLEQKQRDKQAVISVKVGKAEGSRLDLDDAAKEKIWRNYVELKDNVALGWKQKFLQIFERQAKELQDKLNKKDFKKLNPADLMFDEDDEIGLTMRIIEPQYFASLALGADAGVALINEPKINLAAIEKVKEWTERVAEKYATDITKTTKEQFTKLIADGVEAGESPSTLSANIQSYLETVAESRADMIARTESARALTAGEAFAWEEYDIKECEWYLAGSDPCEVCVGNSMADWSTKEAQLGISEYSHPNCECTFLPK